MEENACVIFFSCFIWSSAVYIALAPPTFTSFVFCSENVSDCCGAAAEDFSHVHNTHKSTSSSPHSMMSLMLVIKVTVFLLRAWFAILPPTPPVIYGCNVVIYF